jgi:hypothetical protein
MMGAGAARLIMRAATSSASCASSLGASPMMPSTVTQQGVGLAVRKYVMLRRGVIACDAQRKPGSSLSPTAKSEVDYLLTRLARIDKRAELKPRLAQAS